MELSQLFIIFFFYFWTARRYIYCITWIQRATRQVLHIPRFGLLSSSQFLCTLTHSPTATNHDGMIAIPQQDHELLITRRGDVKLAVEALSGKKKKAGNDVEMKTDDEKD